jgi:hypothetical protein
MSLCAGACCLCASTSEGASKGKKASPTNQCEATWRKAQARSDAGRLREARGLLTECATPACGPVYMQQCATRAAQLDGDIPTIVPLATDDAGAPVVDVQVKADGEVVALRLDGRGVPLDPGLHELSFSTWGHGVFATEKVLIVEGQRNRPISVSIRRSDSTSPAVVTSASKVSAAVAPAPGASTSEDGAPKPAPEPPSVSSTEALPRRRARSALPYVLGGAGLVSVGAGALLTFWGRQDNAALAACSPNCAASDLDHIRSLYLASDIAFGVGAAALGVATVLLVARGAKGDERLPRAGLQLDLHPTASGAFASVGGTF